jgi:hypothetical protein
MCDNEVVKFLIKGVWDIVAEYLQYDEAHALKRYFQWQLPCKPVVSDHTVIIPFFIDRPNTDVVYINNYAGFIHSYKLQTYLLNLVDKYTLKNIAIQCRLCNKYNWIHVCNSNTEHSYFLHVHTLDVKLNTEEGHYMRSITGLCSCVKEYYKFKNITISYRKESKIVSDIELEAIINNHMTWIKSQDGTIRTLLFNCINNSVFTN